jgi:4-alpha-glucanotransferase
LSEFLNDESLQAGVCMHLTSLPGPHGLGNIGDSALFFIDTLVAMGIGVWQFLPTGPTAFANSPYQPLSAFAGNELLIGVEPLVRLGLLAATEVETLNNLPADYVDYEALGPRKTALLSKAAERFAELAGGELKSGYEEFLHLHEKNWLNDYALFRVLKSQHGERAWPEWNEPFMHRDHAALKRVAGQARAAIERIKIIQFLYQRQWQKLSRYAAENAISLFADMPIYVALDSADAWAQPEMLSIDRDGLPTHVAGVPPDYFSKDGQLWGNPLYDWDHHAADGYRWWTRRMLHASIMADLIRVDHFRGFESYWAVPCGSETAKTGEWVPGPGNALFDALSESL